MILQFNIYTNKIKNNKEMPDKKMNILNDKLKQMNQWKANKSNYFIPIGIAIFHVSIGFVRNKIYPYLYTQLENKTFSQYSFSLIVISACNILETFFVKFFLDIYIAYESAKNRESKRFITRNHNNDLSHNISVDQKEIVENYLKFVYYLSYSIIGSLVFMKNLFSLMSFDKASSFAVFSILSITFTFFHVYKKLSKKNANRLLESEANLIKLLHSWYDQSCISVDFDEENFKKYIKNSKKSEILNSFLNNANNLMQGMLILVPYLIFANHFISNKITRLQFDQITSNLFAVIMCYIFIDSAMDYYYKYCANKERLNSIKVNNTIINSENISIKDLYIKYNEKFIIKNFNLAVNSNDIVNIVGKHGKGKSSIMKALQDKIKYEGSISYPLNSSICFIPECASIPQNYKFKLTDEFIYNCKLLNVNPYLSVNECSGSQKWRLIAAWALCHEYIVWDDPFWGEQNEEFLNIFFNNMKSGIIFSSKKINVLKKTIYI